MKPKLDIACTLENEPPRTPQQVLAEFRAWLTVPAPPPRNLSVGIANALEATLKELDEIKAVIASPASLWANIQCGKIARPQVLDHYDQLRAEAESREAAVNTMEQERNDAIAEKEVAERQAAAMRAALTRGAQTDGRCRTCGYRMERHDIGCYVGQALSTTAGKGLVPAEKLVALAEWVKSPGIPSLTRETLVAQLETLITGPGKGGA